MVIINGLFFVGIDIPRILISPFNPKHQSLNKSIYRTSFDESIIVESFKLSRDEKNELDNMVVYAKQALGFEFLFKNDEFIEYYRLFKNDITVSEIKIVIKNLCRTLKLDYRFLDIEIFYINKYFKGYLGYFQGRSKIGGKIGVSLHKKYDFKIIFSIIIHECMHYFMYVHDIRYNLNNEKFTDFLAVYLGLGKYMIEGYKSVLIFDSNFIPGFKDFTVGYLNEKQLSYLERKFNY